MHRYLLAKFPLSNIKNIRIYYLLSFLSSLWFIGGNWIFFWTRYMNFEQLGIVDATCFAFGLFMEVPSGAISDLLGKRKTVIWALFLQAIGGLTIGLAQNLLTIWIAFLVCQLGFALYSGAAEALAYDTLIDERKESEYDNVASTVGYLINIASIAATIVGGFMYAYWIRSTHLAWGIGLFLAFIISIGLKEPKVDTEKFSLKNYFLQLKNGVTQVLKPRLLPYFVVILFLLGGSYIFEWGLVKPTMAIEFGFDANWSAALFAIFGIIAAVSIGFIPYFRKKIKDITGLYILTALMGVGFIVAYFNLGFWGVIPLLLITLAGTLAIPWVSVVFNAEIDSKYRATALSTVALITKIPYVLVAIIAGNMAEKGTFNVFNGSLGLIILLGLLLSVLMFFVIRKK